MNIKQFLKPDWRKIVITFIIFIILILFRISTFIPENIGNVIFIFLIFPFIIVSGCFTIDGGMISPLCIIAFPIGFVLTILFWYLLSYLIVWVYDKFRKVKKK